jgi:acetyl-CoA C-acetyltransferase
VASGSGDGGGIAHRPVYIIDGSRTPFIKARGKPGPFTPVDLAVQCGRPLLLRQPFAPDAFDQVILGCVNVIADEMNPARVAALRLGMGEAMTAFTVQINCGSGMQSIDTAYRYIREGVADLVLAGGAESLSHAPLVFSRGAVNWYARLFAAHGIGAKLSAYLGFRPAFLTPVIGLERGLTDPITELNMGQTAELVAHLFHVTRRQADEYAAESQQRLATAQKNGYFSGEVEPAFARDGTLFDHDDGVRPDSSADALAKLKPAFERPWGKVTPGNSSQITDGASWVILASEAAVKAHKLTPKAVIVDSEWSALDPSVMGLGPVYCSTAIMKRHRLALGDIELWELNEAFAAQVLGCLAAWDDAEFCRDALGLDGAAGKIARDRLNVDGGAIGVGHPVGASGNRIVLHLVNAMKRLGYKRGIATECIGGGQGGAMLIEAV